MWSSVFLLSLDTTPALLHEANSLLYPEIWGTLGQMSHIKEEEVKPQFCNLATIEKLIVVVSLVKALAFVIGSAGN